MKQLALLFIISLTVISLSAQEIGKPLPPWKKGFMDVHHINTGHGVCAFFILPDGTTMLVDAGEMDPTSDRIKSQRNATPHPNGSKRAHEWIADYIKRVHPSKNNAAIDYAMITHFHDDHFGSYYNGAKKSSTGNYFLSGITGVNEYVPIKKLLDRGYPEYNYPNDMNDETMKNYRNFIDHQTKKGTMKAERFKAGLKNQIILLHQPNEFQNFSIQNIKSNGTIWTGEGEKTFEYFPSDKTVYVPGENQLSNALRIDYGDFKY